MNKPLKGRWLTSQDLRNAIILKTQANVVFYKNITALGKTDIKQHIEYKRC